MVRPNKRAAARPQDLADVAGRMAAGPEALDRADPGDDKVVSARENLGGAEISFSPDELVDITAAASKLDLVGDRLPKAYLALTGQ
jgi:hypothetical protein